MRIFRHRRELPASLTAASHWSPRQSQRFCHVSTPACVREWTARARLTASAGCVGPRCIDTVSRVIKHLDAQRVLSAWPATIRWSPWNSRRRFAAAHARRPRNKLVEARRRHRRSSHARSGRSAAAPVSNSGDGPDVRRRGLAVGNDHADPCLKLSRQALVSVVVTAARSRRTFEPAAQREANRFPGIHG